MTWLYIILLCVVAGFIQRTTGFGFGIFIMIVLPYLLPSYGEATTLSGLLALTNSLFIAIKLRKLISLKRLLPILITFIIVSITSVFLLKKTEDHILRFILAIVLILTSLYFIFFSDRIHLKTNLKTQITAGAISGMMGGFFAMQGPPAVLYFLSSEKDKQHYMAMLQYYLLTGNIAMTMARAGNGFLTQTVAISYLYGIIGVIIGTSIGAIVFNKIPTKIFKYVVYSFIGLSGVIILLTLK